VTRTVGANIEISWFAAAAEITVRHGCALLCRWLWMTLAHDFNESCAARVLRPRSRG